MLELIAFLLIAAVSFCVGWAAILLCALFEEFRVGDDVVGTLAAYAIVEYVLACIFLGAIVVRRDLVTLLPMPEAWRDWLLRFRQDAVEWLARAAGAFGTPIPSAPQPAAASQESRPMSEKDNPPGKQELFGPKEKLPRSQDGLVPPAQWPRSGLYTLADEINDVRRGHHMKRSTENVKAETDYIESLKRREQESRELERERQRNRAYAASDALGEMADAEAATEILRAKNRAAEEELKAEEARKRRDELRKPPPPPTPPASPPTSPPRMSNAERAEAIAKSLIEKEDAITSAVTQYRERFVKLRGGEDKLSEADRENIEEFEADLRRKMTTSN